MIPSRISSRRQNYKRESFVPKASARSLLLASLLALTPYAGAETKGDWEKGWASEAFRERLRWESLQDYRKIVTLGGVEVQARLYQVPESELEAVLKKIALSGEAKEKSAEPSRAGRVLPLDAAAVAVIDAAFPREFTWPPILTPNGETERVNLDRRVASLPIEAGKESEWIETGISLAASIVDRAPKFSPRGVMRRDNASASQDIILILSASLAEIIGFSDDAKGTRGHRAAPWKDRLMERLLEFDYPKEGAFPLLLSRQVNAELEVIPEMPEYFLFRLASDEVPQAAGDVLHQQMRRVRALEPLADYPANTLEYWVVFKLQPIVEEKPASL